MAEPQAIPTGSRLVKVGSSYRIVWSLGSNLGWAWYDVKSDQLKNLYGTSTPTAHSTYANSGQFSSTYGNYYFGNVAEIGLKADTPWQDLKDRIFNQFGWVPGFDEPDIKRLLVQAYFEDWDQNQWLVEYRKTNYFQKSTDRQRQWVGYSDAEKAQQHSEMSLRMQDIYHDIWGNSKSLNNTDLKAQSFKVVSGQSTLEQWEYQQRAAAGKTEGTPEYVRIQQENEDLLAPGNEIENLTNFAEKQWRAWVGPIAMPGDFAAKWGANLATGKASEADLENYLKSISNSRWQYKPPELTWEDWSSTYKQQIKNTLELGSIDDEDNLLNQVLSQDLTGVDLNQVIRQDDRFKSTQRAFGELSGMAEEMGRKFGFI